MVSRGKEVTAVENSVEKKTALVVTLLERASRQLELPLCYHDVGRHLHLPKEWMIHRHPACLKIKSTLQKHCARFCGVKVENMLLQKRLGSIHTCPFGHTDVTAPVMINGLVAGVLYGGVFSINATDEVSNTLFQPEHDEQLEDILELLRGLALRIQEIVRTDVVEGNIRAPSRRDDILKFMMAHYQEPLKLGDLASHIHLSESRTGKVLRGAFDETFPKLLTRVRLHHAARWLSLTDWPIKKIALEAGFSDQSHFSRCFVSKYQMTALQYRKQFSEEV